jgi:hypothetical protein
VHGRHSESWFDGMRAPREQRASETKVTERM